MEPGIADPRHVPVLLEETIQALAVQPGGRYIDCTLGTGGHALAILEHSAPGGQLLGIDADQAAIEAARERLSAYDGFYLTVNDNFVNLENICLKYDFFPVHGILFDLGLSSAQLEKADRGFSFSLEGPLDMRFNPQQKGTAADIINGYAREDIARIIRDYGEERFSYRIADGIIRHRPVTSTRQLAEIIEAAVGGKRGKIHPATRTFQALRIAVNSELENLQLALKQAINLLGLAGRLVVISYHSLEDRIVKQFMFQEARDCICPPGLPECRCGHKARIRVLNRKVITPFPEEIERNPRSRSAKLRAAERIILPENNLQAIEDNGLSANSDANGWRRPALLKELRTAFSASERRDQLAKEVR